MLSEDSPELLLQLPLSSEGSFSSDPTRKGYVNTEGGLRPFTWQVVSDPEDSEVTGNQSKTDKSTNVIYTTVTNGGSQKEGAKIILINLLHLSLSGLFGMVKRPLGMPRLSRKTCQLACLAPFLPEACSHCG